MGESNFLLTFVLCKCCLFISFNLAFLVIGILVGNGSSQLYGAVIEYETREWSKPPIVDLLAVNASQVQSCPDGYEMVAGRFFGTKDYCQYFTSYNVGRCKRKQGLYTVEGLDPTTFKRFDDQYLCVKRDNETDYHKLAVMRDARTCSADSGCGSSLDPSKRFCLRGTTTCPPNALLTFMQN
jgi:hypothetical protein